MVAARLGCGAPGASRPPLHVAIDWPGHFPNGAATVAAVIDAGAEVSARRGPKPASMLPARVYVYEARSRVSPDPSADDLRPVPAYRYALMEQIGAGMHSGDFSVVLDDLIDAVELQARAMP